MVYSSCTEPLETTHKSLRGHVRNDINVDSTGDAARIETNPHFSLLVTPKVLTCNGPAKSTAVCENGLLSCTRNLGKGGGRGAVKGLPSNLLHRTHRAIIDFTVFLLFIIQYLDRISVRVSFTPLWNTLLWAGILDYQCSQWMIFAQ